jgi:predicted enzyme related to lactoylglutathione lyase
MGNAVTWFQLSAQDGERLARFYRAFLDWNVREARLTSTDAGVSGTFRVVETGGLSGNISSDDPGVGVVLFVEVDDLGTALERARELGIEKIWREDFDLRELGDADGRYETAWMEDPAGNRLALFQSGAG